MRRARATWLPASSGASSRWISLRAADLLDGCQSIARPAECRLAECLPHISQRYSPQLTPLAFFSSQASIAFVPAGMWPPLQRVASSYLIGSMPRPSILFAGFAVTLGSADAMAGIASASAAARQTMYLIRICTPLISASALMPEAGGGGAGRLRGDRVQSGTEAGYSS